MKRSIAALIACVLLGGSISAQTPETIAPSVPFTVGANHQDIADGTTGNPVQVDGFRLRQNGTIAQTLPLSARDPAGELRFPFPSGLAAGVYDILVTAYNVINGVTTESPTPLSPANIRLTVATEPPPPPPPPDQGWAVNPSSLTVPAAGGSFTGALTACATCNWTAYSTSGWLTVSLTKGTGPASIPFTVAVNTATVARAGNVIIVDAATGSMATNIAVHQVAAGSTPPPPPPPPPAVACADGVDNDGDALIDLADPGCSSATDTDETNVAPPPPPPPATTVTVATANCRWTVSDTLPTGWTSGSVQFRFNNPNGTFTNISTPDSSSPYSRITSERTPGTYEISAVWTRSGVPSVTRAPRTVVCQ